MTTRAARAARYRQISELRSNAAGVVAQARHGPVEIRRYNEPVAYLESVDEHRKHQQLDAAFNRAVWALDLARAIGNVAEGNFTRWETVATTLRTRYTKR